jgi:hypothetical protein
MGCPTRRGGQQRGTALRSWRADQPPPIPVVTLPVPLHSGQLSPSSLPEPLQAGHRFSPVPGVPGGASSPGFVGSVSLISSSLCRRKPSGSDTVPGRAFMQTSRACACHPAPWPPLALSGMGMSGRLSYPPLAGPSATSGSGLPGECGPLPPASGVMFLFSRCSGAGGTVPKASRAASTSCLMLASLGVVGGRRADQTGSGRIGRSAPPDLITGSGVRSHQSGPIRNVARRHGARVLLARRHLGRLSAVPE